MPRPMPLLPPVTSTVRAVAGATDELSVAALWVTGVTLPIAWRLRRPAYAEEVAEAMTGPERHTGYTRQNFSVITDARVSTSEEMAGRVRRYAITMGFRTACFVAMIFVPGVWRWVLFAGAVFLPYIAVVLANQANQRGVTNTVETPPAPDDARRLTVGPEDVISGDVESDGPDLGSGAGPEPDPRPDRDRRPGPSDARFS